MPLLAQSDMGSIPICLSDQTWPSVACTPEELARLRAAYDGTEPGAQVIRRRVQQADEALQRSLNFPPEGGQHNQWYQCDRCQVALETVDDTHHRCPQCGEVYSGYPYDNVIFSRQHYAITRDMEHCAWAYPLTGQEKYAQHARDALVGYAQRYESYPYHSANMGKRSDEPSRSGGHVFEQTLNEASWAYSVCVAYDLIRRSQVVSDADHQAIREHLLRPLYENIAKHRAGKSNWQTYHNSAFMLIGGVLQDEWLIRQAIEDPENGFLYQMKVSVLPGGMWYENSWGYHFYTLGAVQRITETARRLGIDLYSIPQVKQMYTVGMDYRMTDGTLPRFGDATTTRIPAGYYETAYHQWPEPQFLAVLPDEPTWESSLYGRTQVPPSTDQAGLQSVIKSGAGHAILQAEGDRGVSSVAFTFGPFGGFHGHFDKLSFVYFALGRELGYDPGRARSQAYRLPVHRNWYRATVSHNTVVVDRASQEGVEGECTFFLNAPELSAVVARVDDAYPGVEHERLLILRPDFLVVVDLLIASDGNAHSFDWLYHNLGDSIDSSLTTSESEAPQAQGFEYLEDIRRGNTDGPIQATIHMAAGRVNVHLNAADTSEVLLATGVGESVTHRVPLICVTRHGQSAHFAAVLEPVRSTDVARVAGVCIEMTASGGQTTTVQLRDGAEEIYAYAPSAFRRNVQGHETDSRLICLSRNAAGESEVLAEGNGKY